MNDPVQDLGKVAESAFASQVSGGMFAMEEPLGDDAIDGSEIFWLGSGDVSKQVSFWESAECVVVALLDTD